jgi:hypothetical protein
MMVSLLKPPHGGFRIETAKKLMAIYLTDIPNGRKCPFGCNGNVTAVVVGQIQRLYSGIISESLPGIISASSKAVNS